MKNLEFHFSVIKSFRAPRSRNSFSNLYILFKTRLIITDDDTKKYFLRKKLSFTLFFFLGCLDSPLRQVPMR
jgi:hypothetical protein